jgi:hypothetical protein
MFKKTVNCANECETNKDIKRKVSGDYFQHWVKEMGRNRKQIKFLEILQPELTKNHRER